MTQQDRWASLAIPNGDGTTISRCEQCISTYTERKPPGTPPCESCRVELREENKEIAEIFMTVRGQYVTRHNGQYDAIVDVSVPAIKAAMDVFGVTNQMVCMLKVRKLFHHFLGEQDEG